MVLSNIVNNKCPHCHSGNVFKPMSLLKFKVVQMNHQCPECAYNFERESGFYWGAMYVSYGLAVLECFATYLLCRIAGVPSFDFIIMWAMIAAIFVLFPLNYRLSRLVWLYIFS